MSIPKSKRYLTATLLLLVAGIALAFYLRRNSGAPQYVTASVTRGDIEDTVTALGTIQPLQYVDVGAQVSGQLMKLHVVIGDIVKAGDLLAEIDPVVYQAKVSEDQAMLQNLKAQLAEKQAQQQLAEFQFKRNEELFKTDNVVSEDAFQTSEATLKTTTAQATALQAQIQQAESTLTSDQANLNYTKILAPISGTVASITARQGQTLNANQQAPVILRIADLNTVTVWTQVSEADVARLTDGVPVYFTTLGQPDRRTYSKLKEILPTPEVINNVVLYDSLFDVPNEKGRLKVQMSAQVFFVLASATNALLVPTPALTPVGGQAKGQHQGQGRNNGTGAGGGGRKQQGNNFNVQVLKGETVEQRTVTVGVKSRTMAQVLSGLEEGETVITGTVAPAQKPSGKGNGGGGGGKGGR